MKFIDYQNYKFLKCCINFNVNFVNSFTLSFFYFLGKSYDCKVSILEYNMYEKYNLRKDSLFGLLIHNLTTDVDFKKINSILKEVYDNDNQFEKIKNFNDNKISEYNNKSDLCIIIGTIIGVSIINTIFFSYIIVNLSKDSYINKLNYVNVFLISSVSSILLASSAFFSSFFIRKFTDSEKNYAINDLTWITAPGLIINTVGYVVDKINTNLPSK